MKKKRVSFVMALLLCVSMLLSACGDGTGTSIAGSDSAAADNTASPDSVPAKGGGVVTIYTPFGEEYSDDFFAEFTKDTGIEVKYVRLSGGELFSRVQAEADNPQASCWFGAPVETLYVAAEAGYIEPYKATGIEQVSSEGWLNKDDYWTPFCLGVIGILSNNSWLKENNLEAPHTWEELLDPVYKGQVVLAHPATSGMSYAWLNTMTNTYGVEEAFAYMKKLNEHVMQYTKSGTSPGRMVSLGEASVAAVHSHDAVQAMQNAYDVSFRYTPLAGSEVVGMSLIKGAPEAETENAKIFIDWALSPRAQEYWTVNSYRLPVIDGIDLPQEFKDFGYDPSIVLHMDVAENAKNRDLWINRFENEIRGMEDLA